MNNIQYINTAGGQSAGPTTRIGAPAVVHPLSSGALRSAPRILGLASLLAGILSAGASAAEPAQPLVNRSAGVQAADIGPGQRNLVGGSILNPDGSVTHIYQSGRRAVILPGYNETPAGAYQGW